MLHTPAWHYQELSSLPSLNTLASSGPNWFSKQIRADSVQKGGFPEIRKCKVFWLGKLRQDIVGDSQLQHPSFHYEGAESIPIGSVLADPWTSMREALTPQCWILCRGPAHMESPFCLRSFLPLTGIELPSALFKTAPGFHFSPTASHSASDDCWGTLWSVLGGPLLCFVLDPTPKNVLKIPSDLILHHELK